MKKILLGFTLLLSAASLAQTPNKTALNALYQQFRQQEITDSIQVAKLIADGKILERTTIDSTGTVSFIGFSPSGHPIFFATDNTNAAATVGTNLIVSGAPGGYGLTGGGILIGEWDGGEVRTTHQELTGRVTQIDNPSSMSDHATHVCGTMIASGVQASAKGMATAATVSAHSFGNDLTEMTTFANANNILSNHSYGTITGWRQMSGGTWRWYGDTAASGTEDINFGRYTSRARDWDLLANAAPLYLMVKSAGNDRNDVPPASVTSHEVWGNGGWVNSTVSRPQDGGTTGYDCISSYGNAKNILTVGAVSDISNGYTQPSDVNMSSFSGWGPTDDGRIKPDIVANGVSLYSSGSMNNTDYYNSSGTSMSAPNATGTLALLQEMYNDSNGSFMLAATLKGLVIHTANEAGAADGPDYEHGWGLLNAKGAADLIADSVGSRIIEDTLTNQGTVTFSFFADGNQDVIATICWNDPAGTVPGYTIDNSTSVLTNDLDLRVSNLTGTTKLPWTLNPATPSAAAVKADNVRDNVEKVVFDSPAAGVYTFTINHKGTLGNPQAFSLIISGLAAPPVLPLPVVAFTGTPTTICQGDSVSFSHTTTNNPTQVQWSFFGGTPTVSTSNTPQVMYANAGSYKVKLKATNLVGSDSLEVANYITVNPNPIVSHNTLGSACASFTSVPLSGGTPSNGVYSGPAVSNNTFDPIAAGVGTHPVYYTVTNSFGCTTTDTLSIEVVSNFNVVISDTSVCENSVPFTLTSGTPSGGTYSGPGVSNNTFDPAAAGAGTHQIIYNITVNTCAGPDTATFTVLPAPNVQLAAFTDVCDGSAPVTLTGGTPAGGTFTGNAVSNGQFDPQIAGLGVHTIYYTVNVGGCTATDSNTITVGSSTAEITNIQNYYCTNGEDVILVGNPTGGQFMGAGITDSLFRPSTLPAGNVQITYTTSTGACPGTTTYDVGIANPTPIDPIAGPAISSTNTNVSYVVPATNGNQYSWFAQNGTVTSTSNNQATVLWGNFPNGTVSAVLTNMYGCMDTTHYNVELWPLGIEDNSLLWDFNYFPNPVGSALTIQAQVENNGYYTITITNLLGQQLYSQELEVTNQTITTQINTQSLANGQYLLHIKKEKENIAIGKLIKQ